jgi:NTE family protein
MLDRARRLARTRTHLHSNDGLRTLLEDALPVHTFEALPIPFQCVAASIERAAARWFTSGPLVDAILASSAIPGVLPPVELDGEHYLDGGLVDSIPLGRAVQLGAHTVYVLQVGRIESPLTAPESPWDVGMVAFEIARRSRFHETMERLPEHVDVHVLPTGSSAQLRYNDPRQLRYRDTGRMAGRIEAAYEASAAYLADLPVRRS